MPGTWATTTLFNNDQLSSTATTQQQVNRNLPTSNFIGRLTVKIHIVGVGTPTLTLDFLRIIAAGNALLWSTEGGQLRGINKYQNGTVNNGVAVSTTDLIWVFTVNFGRFTHDERMICPAKLYKQLQAQLTFTPGAGTSVTNVNLTMTADEYFSNDDPRTKLVRTVGIVQTVASAANLRGQVPLNRGRLLRAVYVHTDDPDNVNGNSPLFGGTVATTEPIRIRINNGAEVPFEEALDMAKLKNQETYRFDDGDTPDNELSNAAVFTGTEEMVCFDFDVGDTLDHSVDTSKVNDITVTFTGAGSGTSGDVHVLADEFYPVIY